MADDGRTIPGWPVTEQLPQSGCFLCFRDDRLELLDASRPAARGVYADMLGSETRRRLQSGRKSPLARALGLHRRPDQVILDATCGLGRDTSVLLGLGCQVMAAERSPVLQQLLLNALERAGPLPPGWRGLHQGDASELVRSPGLELDAIYIDPMFHAPARKALPKLEMQLLRQVVGEDADVKRLFEIALKMARRRVVVKSHPRGAALAVPDLQQSSGKTRFDIYLTGEKLFR